jgi:tRNA U54 and U55 pseudouridine synthase Pus10
VIEIKNSKIQTLSEEDLKNLTEKINLNSEIGINSLRMADDSILKVIHNGSEEKRKKYRCIVWVSTKIDEKVLQIIKDINELKIFQTTPIRVRN